VVTGGVVRQWQKNISIWHGSMAKINLGKKHEKNNIKVMTSNIVCSVGWCACCAVSLMYEMAAKTPSSALPAIAYKMKQHQNQ